MRVSIHCRQPESPLRQKSLNVAGPGPKTTLVSGINLHGQGTRAAERMEN
jgi:hypothetical protein